MEVRIILRIEHDLGDPIAVSQIDEDELAVIAPAIHPAHQQDILFFVFGRQFAACVRSLQCFHTD